MCGISGFADFKKLTTKEQLEKMRDMHFTKLRTPQLALAIAGLALLT